MSWLKRCKHEKLSEVQADGYQYCEQCCKAFLPPKCVRHTLEDVKQYGITRCYRYGNFDQQVIAQRCTRCGKMFSFNLTNGGYMGETPGS